MILMPSYSIGCFWPARAETVRQCAERLVRFVYCGEEPNISAIELHTIVVDENREGRSMRDLTVASAAEILSEGRIKNDLGQVIEKLGYNAYISGTCESQPISLMLQCGGTTPHLKNSCVAAVSDQLATGDVEEVRNRLVGIARTMIHCWEPYEARIASSSILKWNGKVDLTVPRIGWITYLAPQYGAPPPLPPPSRIERLPNGGHLFYATEDWPDVNDPEDAAALLRVKEVVHDMARRAHDA